MKIGNIVYGDELVNHNQVSYVNYFKGLESYFDNQNDLPTLFVGWKFINSAEWTINKPPLNVLEKTIVPNKMFYEYSFDENKSEHINGVDEFVQSLPSIYFVSKYEYINIDPVFDDIKDENTLLPFLNIAIDFIYIFKNDMMFLKNGEKIFGFDLNMYNFFGFDTNKIIEKTKEQYCNTTHFIDTDGLEYKKQIAVFTNFPYLKRYMCVILA